MIEELVRSSSDLIFVRISTSEERAAIIETLVILSPDDMVFRLPAAIMPIDQSMFSSLMRKLPHGIDQVVFDIFESDAVTLLRRDEAIALLRTAGNVSQRREMLLKLREFALNMPDMLPYADLRHVDQFLRFMTGATEARHFNQLVIEGGVIRKSSADKQKMRAEHDFFHAVPPKMKRFLIPTFDFEDKGATASYCMEAMAIPDGALQLIHHSFDVASAELLMERFFDFVAARHRAPASKTEVRAAAEQETITKMDRRLADLAGIDLGPRLNSLLSQLGIAAGLEGLSRRAKAVITDVLDRDKADHLAVSHGDSCLSNILFSKELGIFRLIDPRGGSSVSDLLMHPAYDIAKLSHSLLGGYDFINSGLFDCSLDDDLGLKLSLGGGGPPPFIREAFIRRLCELGFDIRLVRAMELSLFLSMLPLHRDAPRKLPAFCLAAVEILKELE
ncbi:MAG: hypothetical protein ABIW31_06815 [Novosphingobium sp.]